MTIITSIIVFVTGGLFAVWLWWYIGNRNWTRKLRQFKSDADRKRRES